MLKEMLDKEFWQSLINKKLFDKKYVIYSENVDSACLDMRGKLIIKMNDSIFDDDAAEEITGELKSFDGTDFVVINKTDANNIISMLNEAISKLESGNRPDNDIEVFGDRAISYERLIDALDGRIYGTPITRLSLLGIATKVESLLYTLNAENVYVFINMHTPTNPISYKPGKLKFTLDPQPTDESLTPFVTDSQNDLMPAAYYIDALRDAADMFDNQVINFKRIVFSTIKKYDSYNRVADCYINIECELAD